MSIDGKWRAKAVNMKRPPKKHEMQYHEKKVGIAIPMRANIPTLLKTRAQEHAPLQD